MTECTFSVRDLGNDMPLETTPCWAGSALATEGHPCRGRLGRRPRWRITQAALKRLNCLGVIPAATTTRIQAENEEN